MNESTRCGDVPDAMQSASQLLAQGDVAAAVRTLEEAALSHPASAEIHLNLGALLRAAGDLDSAARAVRQAIALQPDWPEAHYNLGNALASCKAWNEAIESYGIALALRPEWAEARNALGVAYLGASCHDEAHEAFVRARALAPVWPMPSYNLGRAAFGRGDLQAAEEMFRDAIRRAPGFAPAHRDLGIMLLVRGDYENGWPEYEWRWHPSIRSMPFDPALLWDGSLLAGRTILLWQEQGLGDALQFIRYAPLLARHGRVVVMVHPALLRLFRSGKGVETVVVQGDALPPVDIHLPLVSLAGHFGTTLTTIPSGVPYLQVPEEERSRAAALIPADGPFRVGVVWQSGNGRPDHSSRDCPPELLVALANEDIVLYNLQHRVASGELPFEDLPTGDFASTAALVERLDLIVTVDTAMAHLAGALGKPVFLLVGDPPDWRWSRDGDRSPWYPTMLLFRRHHRPWVDVITDVRRGLLEVMDASTVRGSSIKAR